MSLAKRAAKTMTVESESVQPPASAPAPTPAPETPAFEPEPLGAHESPGNKDARRAFVEDESDENEDTTIKTEPTPEEKAEGKTESLPGMTIEEIAVIATFATSAIGSTVGTKVLKRPDIQWALSNEEQTAVQAAYVPVLKEALQDTKVTPLHALVAVLLSCYAPRAIEMATTKNPGAAPAPRQEPPQVEAPKEKEVNSPPAPKPQGAPGGW